MDGFVVHSDHISLNEMLTVNSHAISWLIPFFLYRRSTTYRGSFGNTLIMWPSVGDIPIWIDITSSNLPSDPNDYVDVATCTAEVKSAEDLWANNSGFGFDNESNGSTSNITIGFINNPSLFKTDDGSWFDMAYGCTHYAVVNNNVDNVHNIV